MALTDVAAALNNILWLDLEGRWVIDLLEVTCEVALVVILPLDESGDLISELRVGDVAACLVHSALVASLESWSLCVVPEAATLVASLMLRFA